MANRTDKQREKKYHSVIDTVSGSWCITKRDKIIYILGVFQKTNIGGRLKSV